jgi:transposase
MRLFIDFAIVREDGRPMDDAQLAVLAYNLGATQKETADALLTSQARVSKLLTDAGVPSRSKNIKFNKTDRDAAVAKFKAGQTVRGIAEELGISQGTIETWLRQTGQNRDQRRAELKRLRVRALKLYQQGKTNPQIKAELVNISSSAIQKWIQGVGISRKPHEVQGITDEMIARGIKLYEAGYSTGEIGRQLGVAGNTVLRWAAMKGYRRDLSEAKGVTKEQKLRALELYKAGYTTTEAAKAVGVGNSAVGRWAKEASIPMRTLSEAQALRAAMGKVRHNGIKSVVTTKWGPIRAESVYEAARLRELEMDDDVVHVARSVERIPWGEGRHYNPDLAIRLSSGCVRIEEVKPQFRAADASVLAKAKAARSHFSKQGIDYTVVTEKDIYSGVLAVAGMAGLHFASDAERVRFAKAAKGLINYIRRLLSESLQLLDAQLPEVVKLGKNIGN